MTAPVDPDSGVLALAGERPRAADTRMRSTPQRETVPDRLRSHSPKLRASSFVLARRTEGRDHPCGRPVGFRRRHSWPGRCRDAADRPCAVAVAVHAPFKVIVPHGQVKTSRCALRTEKRRPEKRRCRREKEDRIELGGRNERGRSTQARKPARARRYTRRFSVMLETAYAERMSKLL